METFVRVCDGCSSQSCDSIKSLRIAKFCYTTKAALVALERESLTTCIEAESPEVLKSKEERIRHLF